MAFESVFLRLQAVIDAKTEDFHREMEGAKRKAQETAEFVDRQRGTVDLDAKIAEFEAKAKYVRAETARLDKLKAEVEVGADTSELDRAMAHLDRQSRGIEKTLSRLRDTRAFADMGGDIQATSASIQKNTVEVERNRRGLIAWIMALGALPKSLGEVRIHMGIASLTAKQFMIALGTLGPIIMALVGSASALIGVLGSGLVGAAGLAGAAITGLGLGFLGLKAAMAPMKADMDAATGAFDSMQDAIREHGKGSQEAKDAMKEYQQVLKNIDPAAAKAVKSLNKLKAGFEQRTGPARKSMFGLMADGLQRATNLMPDFARETNNFASSLRTAGQNFMQAFDLSEMRASLTSIMGNFSDALPTLGTALGNIAEAMANIFASFGRHFDNVANGILKWSKGFADANKSGQALNDRVDGMVASAERLVEFFAAAGRVMMTFFGAGADEGRGILDSWTRSLDDLNAAMKTTEGQEGLNKFFDESIDLARDFFHAVKDIISVFVDFAQAMAPVTEAALKIVEAFADIVDALADIEVLGFSPFKALMTGLGTLMGVGMIGGALKRIPLLGTAMAGMGAAAANAGRRAVGLTPIIAGTSAAAAKAGKTFTDSGGRLRYMNGQFAPAAASAAATTGRLGALGSAAASTASTIARGAGAFLRFAGPVGMTASVALLAADALGIFGNSGELTQQQLDGLQLSTQGATQSLANQTIGLRSISAAFIQYGQAAGRSGQVGEAAMIQLKNAIAQVRQEAQGARASAITLWDQNVSGAMDDALSNMVNVNNALEDMDDHWRGGVHSLDTIKEKIKASVKATGELSPRWEGLLRKFGASDDAIQRLKDAVDPGFTKGISKAAQQMDRVKLSMLNAARAGKNMSQIPMKMSDEWGKFQRLVGREQAFKLGVTVDDGKAMQKLTRLTQSAKQLTNKETVMKILARSESADEAIRKLQRLRSNARKPIDAILRARDEASPKAKEARQNLENIPDRTNSNIKAQDGASRIAQVAKSALENVIGTYVGRIEASDQASGVINSILGSLFTIVSRVWTATVGASGGGNAQGGIAHDVGPAYAKGGSFSRRPGKMGGRFSSPTFLVGEETRPEFVIATNPAYRKANLNYLNMAASSLGQAVVPAFARGGAYQAGAIPVDKAESDYDRARGSWEKARDREKRLRERQQDYRRRNTDRDRKNDVPGSVMSLSAAELRRATRERERQERQMKRSKRLMKATKAAHRHREGLEKEISRDQAEMDSARSRGAAGSFERWRDETLRDINALLDKLRPAYRRAGGQYKTELGTRIAELEAQRERTGRDSMGVEGMLSPAEQARLERLTGQVAYAQTTEGGTDDIAANRSLVSFWEGIVSKLTQGPQSGWNWAAVGEASQNLQGARDAAFNVTGGGIVAAGQVYSNARQDLYRQFGSNVSWQDGAVMGHSQQGGNTVINNWSTPPPDPHTWSQQQAWEMQTI